MGYNEIKAIEVRELVRAAAGEAVELWPDFSVAHRIQRYCDATILLRRRAALGGGERDPGVGTCNETELTRGSFRSTPEPGQGDPGFYRSRARLSRMRPGVRAETAQDQCSRSGPSAP